MFVVILFLSACGSKTNKMDGGLINNTNLQKKTDSISEEKTSKPLLQEDSVFERYLNFEVAMACALAEAGTKEDPNEIVKVVGQTKEFIERFGFTPEEIRPLTEKYKNDLNFKTLAEEKMKKDCPDIFP